MKIQKIIILFAVLLLALFMTSCGSSDAVEGEIQVDDNNTVEEGAVEETETIKIGFMGPLSGDAASYGESIKRGVDLAAADMGLDIELVYEDSMCDAKEAATVVHKLISVDGVIAIVGEVCSSATLAAAPVAEAAGVVMVSPSSTSPALTDAGDYLFRTVPSDALQGDFGADLVSEMGYSKLAVLYVNDDYGVGFMEVLEAEFAGEIVASEAIEGGSVDVRTQLTKIKDAEADALYIISNSPDSIVAALEQIVELGLDVTVFGSEGLKADVIVEGAGEAAEGMYVTSVSFGTEAFTAAHEAAYGEAPGPFAAQGYDAMYAIGMALINGASTGAEVRDALYDTAFDGVSGSLSFDENGDVYGNYELFQVQDGAFVAVG
jgi:branched-chain amino acid transport system substrate-binding protein